MYDRRFLNKLGKHLSSQSPVTPGAITDIATGRPDMTVTPGAITDMAGGGGGSVAPNSITDGGAVGETERDAL